MKENESELNENDIPNSVKKMKQEKDEQQRTDTNQFEQVKQRKPNNTFIKKYVLFIILLILITAGAIGYTIYTLNQGEVEEEPSMIEQQEEKKTAEDAKFAIENYSETYDENSLRIINYIDVDGKVSTYNGFYEGPTGKTRIEFVQIEGLKNKSIQNALNAKLKQEAYNLNKSTVYTYVTADFSNVLSVSIEGFEGDGEGKYEYAHINVDLTTGEEIPFEKVFVSSAPINSYLAEGLYESLAWDNLRNEEEMESVLDMSKVDTSEYEDEFYKVVNKYKKVKGNVAYSVSPSKVTVYGLKDTKENYDTGIDIKFSGKVEEIAIYKRYLTNTNIFENEQLGEKNLIVLTSSMSQYQKERIDILNYGKISNNIFMEDYVERWIDETAEEEQAYLAVKKYFQQLSNEQKNKLQISNDKGMFYQRRINFEKKYNEEFYVATITEVRTTCDISYFKNLAFKDYSDMKNAPSADDAYYIFSSYMKEEYPNLNIVELSNYDENRKEMYFSKTGEYLGSTEEEAREKLGYGVEENTIEEIIEPEIEPEEYEVEEEILPDNTTKNTIDNTTVNTTTNTMN